MMSYSEKRVVELQIARFLDSRFVGVKFDRKMKALRSESLTECLRSRLKSESDAFRRRGNSDRLRHSLL